jgi:hypothetical protein
VKRGFALVLGLVAALGTAPAVQAQAQEVVAGPRGFFFSGGLGVGSAGLTCDPECDSDREVGGVAHLRFGYAVSPRLVLAVESNAFSKRFDVEGTDYDAISGVFAATVALYPAPRVPLFVKAGIGGGVTLFQSDDAEDLDAIGLGLIAGAGYDIPVGSKIRLTPFVNYVSAFNAQAKVEGEDFGDLKLGSNNFQGGLAITLY